MPSQPLPITFPNIQQAPAGSKADLYFFDLATGTWAVSPANPFQYTGREHDGTAGLYYRARFYSPSLSRFIGEDPVDFAGGRNFYRYVQNNPMTLTDPSGLIGTSLILRSVAIALRTGATAEEIAVQARIADVLFAGAAAVIGPLIPPGASGTPIPGTGGLTIGHALHPDYRARRPGREGCL